jgi:hypothetical protein
MSAQDEMAQHAAWLERTWARPTQSEQGTRSYEIANRLLDIAEMLRRLARAEGRSDDK